MGQLSEKQRKNVVRRTECRDCLSIQIHLRFFGIISRNQPENCDNTVILCFDGL